jgi:aspartyl-tRNA synthetase
MVPQPHVSSGRPLFVVVCRQPEFSQLDMEMAFMDQDAIIALVEAMVLAVFDEVHFSWSN